MIVYGDPQCKEQFSRLRARICECPYRIHSGDLDQLRALLIEAGQLEQGLFDWFAESGRAESPLRKATCGLTETVAAQFIRAWARICEPGFHTVEPQQGTLRGAADELRRVAVEADPVLTIKIPEGFAFYALYPEQYCCAAWNWAKDRRGNQQKRALVVGIRSIGTSLSAVVREVLRDQGWEADRLTVRPTGHPYSRKADLPINANGIGAESALVVDEGPGLSGSSMSAVAEALAAIGIRDIAFLPGHAGGPGSAASEAVRDWWARVPRYVVAQEQLRWHGLSLREVLKQKAEEICDVRRCKSTKIASLQSSLLCPPPSFAGGEGDASLKMARFHAAQRSPSAIEKGDESLRSAPIKGKEDHSLLTSAATMTAAPKMTSAATMGDVSGGGWREFAYEDEAEWPAVCAGFERMKFLYRSGSGDGVLWKFCGLEAPGRDNLALRKKEAAWNLGSMRSTLGFVAIPWAQGSRLHTEDAANDHVLRCLAQHINQSAGPPLEMTEAEEATARLGEMLYWNCHEAFGEAMAEKTRRWTKRAKHAAAGPSYGDGRMAPWEWVGTAGGENLLKTDCGGHDCDHTVVGRQSVLWDVAGTLVEWDLAGERVRVFLEELRNQGVSAGKEELKFYEMAYAAFRLGMVHLSASQVQEGSTENLRLERAKEFYGSKLAGTVKLQH